MKQIIYLTGSQGSGKSMLSNSFKNSIEISYYEKALSVKYLINQLNRYDTIVISNQVFNNSFKKTIKILAKQLNVLFFNIKL